MPVIHTNETMAKLAHYINKYIQHCVDSYLFLVNLSSFPV